MKQLTIILILIFGLTSSVGAYVSESTNYKIDVDSINLSGGTGESTNYSINSTVGEVGTGESSSTNYIVHAGYQAMLGSEVTLTLTSPSDVTMSPSITVGETSNGSVAWTVVTNNSAGYSLSTRASTNPAMVSGSNDLDDYAPSGGADFTWATPASSAYFGFSPEGTDISSTYKDNGSTCGVGASDASDSCWDGFSTSNQTIASKSSATAGSSITLKMKAEIGASANVSAGGYSAQITVTATAL